MGDGAAFWIFLLLAALAAVSWKQYTRAAKHCLACGTEAQPKVKSSLSALCWVAAMALGVIGVVGSGVWLLGALLFAVLAAVLPSEQCPACGAKGLVPVDSPAAQAARAKYSAAGATPTPGAHAPASGPEYRSAKPPGGSDLEKIARGY